jgi:glycosyltransferase involved in cell wall biosynthesis
VAGPRVSVAIPVLDGGTLLDEVLAAVRAQRIEGEIELVVCDSGSRDGSVALARSHGAEVVEISRGEFGHGRTRNLLMERTRAPHVAFLTQDATPAGERWLARLLEALELDGDAALVTGPYRARPGAPAWLRREYRDWFAAMADGAEPRMVRAADLPRDASGQVALSPATFSTSANALLARAAWERVPFRDVAYAEDQRLGLDLLAAGYAKVFHPGAAVLHSHDYAPGARLRRTFDEFRALREVYGHVAPADPRALLGRARRDAARDRAFLRAEGVDGTALDRATLAAAAHHVGRGIGAALGTRADRLPGALRRRLSLEGRGEFDSSAG